MTTPQIEINQARNILYRELMAVPHRDYAPSVLRFREALHNDPDFTARTCVFIATGGSKIRDHADIGIITLLTANSTYPEYREAGRVLLLGSDVYDIAPASLSGLPPYRLMRVFQFVNEQSEHKIPRLLKTMANDYLHMLESDPLRFDGVVIQNRRNMRWMYTNFHIKPSARANDILFHDNPPEDSKLSVLKQIANSTDTIEQANLVIDNKIPYRVAVSVLPKVTPEIGVALIAAMSPTEALNSRSWVERSGLLEMPEVKDVFVSKVSKATASVASADHRASAQGQDEDVQAAVEQAKQKSVEKADRIEKDLLILVDKSGSMDDALPTAVQFGARIAPLCDSNMMVVVHNDYGKILEVNDPTQLASWEQAFKGQRAGGGTNMERSFAVALEAGFMPQAVVFITDGGERSGNCANALTAYAQHNSIDVQTVIIRVPGSDLNWLGERLQNSGLRYDTFEYSGDYYLFDQVSALLGGPPAKTMVERILETELPHRI